MNGNKARIGMSIGACLILILLTFFSLRNMDLEEKILSELTFVYENVVLSDATILLSSLTLLFLLS